MKYLSAIGLTYLVWSFITLQFNPTLWSEPSRVFFVLNVALACSLLWIWDADHSL
jgi:hypothetical protein